MTQKLIANMLGVHRVDVTNATGKLQKDGLISYGSASGSMVWYDQHRTNSCLSGHSRS